MGTCYFCGKPAELLNNDEQLVCTDCWIMPPGSDSISRFIRETTDNNNDDNDDGEP